MNPASHQYWKDLTPLAPLGCLEPSEQAGLALHLQDCAECRAETAEWHELAANLAYASHRAEPPTHLRARLLASLDVNNMKGRKVVRAAAAPDAWQSAGAPGVSFRMLQKDEATGDQTLLVRLAPGAVYSPHRHAANEHCYVLEGDLVFDDHTLNAGDYAVAAPGTDHSKASSMNGCLLLIVNNERDQLLPMM
jgi:quercetin dioxygenase-like cupin family protein